MMRSDRFAKWCLVIGPTMALCLVGTAILAAGAPNGYISDLWLKVADLSITWGTSHDAPDFSIGESGGVFTGKAAGNTFATVNSAGAISINTGLEAPTFTATGSAAGTGIVFGGSDIAAYTVGDDVYLSHSGTPILYWDESEYSLSSILRWKFGTASVSSHLYFNNPVNWGAGDSAPAAWARVSLPDSTTIAYDITSIEPSVYNGSTQTGEMIWLMGHGQQETQTVAVMATGGTFTLDMLGWGPTAPIGYNSSALSVQTKLRAIAVNTGVKTWITATGGPLNTNDVTVHMMEALGQVVAGVPMTADIGSLGGICTVLSTQTGSASGIATVKTADTDSFANADENVLVSTDWISSYKSSLCLLWDGAFWREISRTGGS